TSTATDTQTSTPTSSPTFAPPPSSPDCPGFGASSAGTYPGSVGGSAIRLALHTLSSTSAVTAVAFYLHTEGPIVGSGARAAIYADAAGTPLALLTQSAQVSNTLVSGWNTIPVTMV